MVDGNNAFGMTTSAFAAAVVNLTGNIVVSPETVFDLSDSGENVTTAIRHRTSVSEYAFALMTKYGTPDDAEAPPILTPASDVYSFFVIDDAAPFLGGHAVSRNASSAGSLVSMVPV